MGIIDELKDAAAKPANDTRRAPGVDRSQGSGMARGMEQQPDGQWLALTFTESKYFKTQSGAEKWLKKRGTNPDGSRIAEKPPKAHYPSSLTDFELAEADAIVADYPGQFLVQVSTGDPSKYQIVKIMNPGDSPMRFSRPMMQSQVKMHGQKGVSFERAPSRGMSPTKAFQAPAVEKVKAGEFDRAVSSLDYSNTNFHSAVGLDEFRRAQESIERRVKELEPLVLARKSADREEARESSIRRARELLAITYKKPAPKSKAQKAWEGRPDFEQRREGRVERLEARAKKARSEGRARLDSSSRIADAIPMGQPILVGHHSEKRHRRDIERIQTNATKGFELLGKAERLERQAQTSEENLAISSDDPQAIVKLKKKLASLEAGRAEAKAINALHRKGGWPAVALAIGQTQAQKMKTSSGLTGDDKPWPGYSMTNIGANIRRIKDRITVLERAASSDAPKPYAYNGVELRQEDNRVKIIFPGKPSAELRKKLKSNGFRWSPRSGAWQRHASPQAWHIAEGIVNTADLFDVELKASVDARADAELAESQAGAPPVGAVVTIKGKKSPFVVLELATGPKEGHKVAPVTVHGTVKEFETSRRKTSELTLHPDPKAVLEGRAGKASVKQAQKEKEQREFVAREKTKLANLETLQDRFNATNREILKLDPTIRNLEKWTARMAYHGGEGEKAVLMGLNEQGERFVQPDVATKALAKQLKLLASLEKQKLSQGRLGRRARDTSSDPFELKVNVHTVAQPSMGGDWDKPAKKAKPAPRSSSSSKSPRSSSKKAAAPKRDPFDARVLVATRDAKTISRAFREQSKKARELAKSQRVTARDTCKSNMQKTRELIKEKRALERERLNAWATVKRLEVRSACKAKREGIRATVTGERERIAQERELVKLERERIRMIANAQKNPRRIKAGQLAFAKRGDSDDEVRNNLTDAEALLWDKVKHRSEFSKKANPRRSRTEAFHEYLAENSEDLEELLETNAESAVEELVSFSDKCNSAADEIDKRIRKAFGGEIEIPAGVAETLGSCAGEMGDDWEPANVERALREQFDEAPF